MANVMEKFSLKGRTALVTGGAGLLGRQFTRALGEAGARVVVADLDYRAAECQAQKLSEGMIDARPVKVDITDQDFVQEMVAFSVAAFGRVDILVNSAAMDAKFDPDNLDDQFMNTFEAYPLEKWKAAMDINLTGMFLVCQAAARQMVKQNYGVMINIGSTYGLVGPDQRLYQRSGGSTAV